MSGELDCEQNATGATLVHSHGKGDSSLLFAANALSNQSVNIDCN